MQVVCRKTRELASRRKRLASFMCKPGVLCSHTSIKSDGSGKIIAGDSCHASAIGGRAAKPQQRQARRDTQPTSVFLARGAVLHCRRRLRVLHCRRRRTAVRHCRQRWRAASHHCRRRLRVLQCQERHFRGLQHRLRRWIRFGGLQQRLRGWKSVFGRPRKSVFRRCQKIFVPWTEGC